MRERERQRDTERKRERMRERERKTERHGEIREKQSKRLIEKKHSYNKGICVRLHLRLSYRMLVAQCQHLARGRRIETHFESLHPFTVMGSLRTAGGRAFQTGTAGEGKGLRQLSRQWIGRLVSNR